MKAFVVGAFFFMFSLQYSSGFVVRTKNSESELVAVAVVRLFFIENVLMTREFGFCEKQCITFDVTYWIGRKLVAKIAVM